MEIKLNSLILENFKGISYFELNVDGKNASVYGTNASGKTTLADAYFWLLFGKDSNGAANFDIKTIGTTGLDYSVTGTIEVNGKMHILQRILKEKWERKNGETEKKFKGNTICPFCGRALPEDKIQSALDEFNMSKSNQLEEITDECAKLKLERSEIKKTLIVHSNNLESAKSKLSQIIENIELLEKSLAKPKRFEDTEEYKNLYEKLVAAEKNVISEEQRFNESVAEKIMKMKSRIEEINRQSSDLIAILAKVSTIKIYEDRIEELKKQESDYGVLLAEADKDLNLIDEFIKIKCLDVEKMINSHFKVVKWKLFSLQVNGGINDCCEATVDGVDYSTNLNSAAKLNAGLDIINTISDVTGINVPIWIDNAESVVSYIPTTSQTIKLTVSKEYKKLTIKE